MGYCRRSITISKATDKTQQDFTGRCKRVPLYRNLYPLGPVATAPTPQRFAREVAVGFPTARRAGRVRVGTHPPRRVIENSASRPTPGKERGAASKDAAPLLLRQPCGCLLFCDCRITWRKQAPRHPKRWSRRCRADGRRSSHGRSSGSRSQKANEETKTCLRNQPGRLLHGSESSF